MIAVENVLSHWWDFNCDMFKIVTFKIGIRKHKRQNKLKILGREIMVCIG
jgi:hypothetical protein